MVIHYFLQQMEAVCSASKSNVILCTYGINLIAGQNIWLITQNIDMLSYIKTFTVRFNAQNNAVKCQPCFL